MSKYVECEGEEDRINKATLVTKIAESSGLSKTQADAALKAFVEVVEDALKSGDSIQLTGFGAFKVNERKMRTARNPRTGETIEVPARKSPAFRFSKVFKDQF